MKDTFNTFNGVLKVQRPEDIECVLHCKLLAKKLRGPPESEHAIFMYEINGLFINFLRNNSSPSTYIYIYMSLNYIYMSLITSQNDLHTSHSSYSEPNMRVASHGLRVGQQS